MSIAVSMEDLPNALEAFPWGYLVTVSDAQRAHSLAVPTQFTDGVFTASAGRGTCANIVARPDVTIVFPPASGTEYSLIVDGRAVATDGRVEITPTTAVMHRPALSDAPSC